MAKFRTMFFSLIAVGILVAVVGLLPTQSRAQDEDKNFKVGDKVEYKASSYPKEVWKEGTVIKLYPEYRQVLIRWDPRPDYPEYTKGNVSTYEQGYSIN